MLPAVGAPKPQVVVPTPAGADAKAEPAPKQVAVPVAIGKAAQPTPSPERADDSDALATALTGDSPTPPAVVPHATQVMAAVSLPVTVAAVTAAQPTEGPISVAEPSRPTLTSEAALESVASRTSRRVKTEPRAGRPVIVTPAVAAKAKTAGSPGAWLVKALLAFAVSYAIVSYYRASVMHSEWRWCSGPRPRVVAMSWALAAVGRGKRSHWRAFGLLSAISIAGLQASRGYGAGARAECRSCGRAEWRRRRRASGAERSRSLRPDPEPVLVRGRARGLVARSRQSGCCSVQRLRCAARGRQRRRRTRRTDIRSCPRSSAAL